MLDRAWERVREEVAAGHQAYVVCPRIGGADAVDDEPSADGEPGAGDETTTPRGRPSPSWTSRRCWPRPAAGLRVGVLHGRLPAEDKDDVMRRFAAGELDVLVATTVIEVGVDVPNATVMVVLDADRFGVSQLHQLRGRVGRGSARAVPAGDRRRGGHPARERLDAVAATNDGFELSRLDLETRREGDVLGASQSGRRSSLRLLSVLRDEDVIARPATTPRPLVADDPELTRHPALRAAVAASLDDERADYLEKA